LRTFLTASTTTFACGADVPMPYSKHCEAVATPQANVVVDAVKKVLNK
jgi:pyruvate/2-oxoglutarate/acetoin dehydrogenase E1 component